MNRRQIGSEYEAVAANYLKKNGYEIIMLNYRCRLGEIDIIAREGKNLVFVEVKYRKTLTVGDPLEAIDFRKQARIRKACQYYLMEHNMIDVPVRFDAVGILDNKITLIKDAF